MVDRLLAATATATATALLCALPSNARIGPWPAQDNGHDGERFSPARGIAPENVETLK